MIEPLKCNAPMLLGFRLSGKLHDEDYLGFVPEIDAAVAKYDKVRLLTEFHDFEGWDPDALWNDLQFSTLHGTKIDRIALVGDKSCEAWMARLCKPFTMARVRYFDAAEIDAAWDWLARTR